MKTLTTYSTYLWSDQHGAIYRGKGPNSAQEATSDTIGCCVLGDGVAGLQFISPFVRDYTVTFLAVCIQSSWSLSSFSTAFILYIYTSAQCKFTQLITQVVLQTLARRCPKTKFSLLIICSLCRHQNLCISSFECSPADTCSTGWTACEYFCLNASKLMLMTWVWISFVSLKKNKPFFFPGLIKLRVSADCSPGHTNPSRF